MDALALIEQAQELGLDLSIVDGSLKVKGPRSASSFISLLRQHRDEVIGVLTTTTRSAPPPPQADSTAGTHSSADARTRSLFAENEDRVSAGQGVNSGNGGEPDPFNSAEVLNDLRNQTRPKSTRRDGDSAAGTCGPLHIQPERWERHGDRAHCPGCGKFMGIVKNQLDQDGHLQSSNREGGPAKWA